jgi:hypothetical protein
MVPSARATRQKSAQENEQLNRLIPRRLLPLAIYGDDDPVVALSRWLPADFEPQLSRGGTRGGPIPWRHPPMGLAEAKHNSINRHLVSLKKDLQAQALCPHQNSR